MTTHPKAQVPNEANEKQVIDQRLVLLGRHWHDKPLKEHTATAEKEQRREVTIAISREAGSPGAEVAQEIGKRIDWPVYDREILDLIAERTVLRSELLESIDEHDRPWLVEALTSLSNPGEISSAGYFHHLTRVLGALSSHGRCIIVGRGATALLSPARQGLRSV